MLHAAKMQNDCNSATLQQRRPKKILQKIARKNSVCFVWKKRGRKKIVLLCTVSWPSDRAVAAGLAWVLWSPEKKHKSPVSGAHPCYLQEGEQLCLPWNSIWWPSPLESVRKVCIFPFVSWQPELLTQVLWSTSKPIVKCSNSNPRERERESAVECRVAESATTPWNNVLSLSLDNKLEAPAFCIKLWRSWKVVEKSTKKKHTAAIFIFSIFSWHSSLLLSLSRSLARSKVTNIVEVSFELAQSSVTWNKSSAYLFIKRNIFHSTGS